MLICIGIPVEVYQYLVTDDWCSIKVEGPEHTVIEIEGFPVEAFKLHSRPRESHLAGSSLALNLYSSSITLTNMVSVSRIPLCS